MWLLSVTERVHAMRAMQDRVYADPEWVKWVSLEPRPVDAELLRLRGRFVYSHPGLEIQ